MNQIRNRSMQGRQRGAVTLVMSLILLVLTSMVALYTGSAILFERKISANVFRSAQAFEAAESGIATALAYMGSAGGADKDKSGAVDPVFDTDGDGIGNVNTNTYSDSSSVTVTITGVFPNYTIQAVGVSDDGTATRTISVIGATVDSLPNAPDNPITTGGSVFIDGSATVHNPEGNSTIWSGASVNLGSNNATATNIADPADVGYPTCMDTSMTCGTTPSSSKVAIGLDVIENDSSLANLTPEQMFRNFFGASMANYRDSRVTLEVAAADANNLASNTSNPGVQLAAGEVIWIEGDTSLVNNTTVGCEVLVTGAGNCPAASLDPSILIVNGNLTTDGTPTIYGILYVVGNINMDGNNTIHGAMVVGGVASNSASGSLDIWYNSSILQQSRDNGPLAGSPGSWRDW